MGAFESSLKLRNGICCHCGDADQDACDMAEYMRNYDCRPPVILVADICRSCRDIVLTGPVQCSCIPPVHRAHVLVLACAWERGHFID